MADRSSTKTLMLTTVSVIVAAVAIAAQAQTVTSPFAKKKKKQAWETQAPAQPAPTQTQTYNPAPQTYPAQPQSYPSSTYTQGSSSGTYVSPSSLPQGYTESGNLPDLPEGYSYAPATPAQAPSTSSYSASPYASGTSQNAPTSYPSLRAAPPADKSYEVETLSGYPSRPPVYSGQSGSVSGGAYYPGRSASPQPYSGPTQSQSGPSSAPPMGPPPKRSWFDRMGLSSLVPTISGFLKLGAAGTRRNGDWNEDFIADGQVRAEVSGVTQGGLEYGVGTELRGQYDKYRRGFGGRVGDCPPSLAGCANVLVAGTPTAIRGHTSQFYTAGASNAKEEEFAVEGLYVFLRSAYGDITAGRDDGAAYLFSLGAPTLLAVGASNNGVDYTGLDAVKTVNDASGFAEKITYVSPRLLGDTVGVGIQVGASYTPDSKICGTDYCVRANGKDGSGALSPDMEDVLEFGVSLDRKFANGMSIEATGTYAMASEQSGLAPFDDLKAWGAGLELGYNDFTLGGSYLDSNNGLLDGDYTAWDVGATWKPSSLGFTLGYGQAKDKNIDLKSDQGVFGITYDWNERYRLGTGVQYIERTVPFEIGGVATPTKEKATSIFVEGRITF